MKSQQVLFFVVLLLLLLGSQNLWHPVVMLQFVLHIVAIEDSGVMGCLSPKKRLS